LASALGVATLGYIFVSTQGALGFRGLLTDRVAASPVAAPSTQVEVSGAATTPTRSVTTTPTSRPAAATLTPTQPPTPTEAPTSTPVPSPTPAPPTATPVPLLASEAFEETFGSNDRRWPNNPQSTAWLGDGGYRLAARQPSQFVALRAPGSDRLSDVRVTGVFRKLGGPAGGGYGLILRDQSPARLDGVAQTGKFYVFEVGDRGEVGVWRRDGDTWVDILPWTPSPAVQSGGAPNELVAQARGSQLDFFVNGIQVASGQDAALSDGGVGVFVGGDGNDVLLNRFAVQPLS
jgi:hypothetical protein